MEVDRYINNRREKEAQIMTAHVPDACCSRTLSANTFEKKGSIMHYSYISTVTVCVGKCALNAHTGGEGRGWGWMNGGPFSFSLCLSHFAPLIPALAEAIHEGSEAPVRNVSNGRRRP